MFLIAFLSIVVFITLLRVYKLVVLNKFFNEPVTVQSNASPLESYFLTKEINAYSVIKKLKLKFLFSSICVCLVLLFNISANVSFWPNVKGLSIEDKQNSIAFRNLRGSNCINEFNALKSVLDNASKNDYSTSDIKNILGNPDKILNNGTTLQYNLFPSNTGCVGLIECSNNKVMRCSVTNCN